MTLIHAGTGNSELVHSGFAVMRTPLCPIEAFDSWSERVPIGGAIAYKAAGAFTAVPTGVYDLRARATGATTDAIVRTAVSFVAGRVYTIGARGDITVVSTTATNRPFLDNTANR